jgi:hypothetical protein
MPDDTTCRTCGAPLPADSPPDANCAACEAEIAQGTLAAPEDLPVPTPTYPPARAVAASMQETIGDFVILGKIGQGGMGAVYEARQTSLNRVVALKILPAQFAEEPDAIARFRREATLAAQLNHPNLVRVYASGEADGCNYIAMELVTGENLRQRLKRGALEIPEALRICREVVLGLQCGWQRGQLVHRDIKPSNIYLGQNSDVKLGDLGIAKSLTSNTTGLTHTGAAIGTPLYMSPEQARGDKTIDFRADIYSLGCTFYEMLTGHAPYQGTDGHAIIHQHLHSPLPAILKELPQCPMPVVRLLGRMLKKNPRERHTSHDELIADMERAQASLETGGTNTVASDLVAAWRELGEGARPTPSQAIRTPMPRAAKPMSLYIGVAVAVTALAGLLLWSPWKERAPGSVVAKARGNDAKAPVGTIDSTSASTPPPAAAQKAVGKWIDCTEKVRIQGLKTGDLVAEGEWLSLAPGKAGHFTQRFSDQPLGNVAIRIRYATQAYVSLRQSETSSYHLFIVGRRAAIHQYNNILKKDVNLTGEVNLPSGYEANAEHELIFTAQDDRLSFALDGKETINIKDLPMAVGERLQLKFEEGCRIKKVEYAELAPNDSANAKNLPNAAASTRATDAASSAAAAAATYPQPARWIDYTEKMRSNGLKSGELIADGEWLALAPAKTAYFSGGLTHQSLENVAIRLRYMNWSEFALRGSKNGSYILNIWDRQAAIKFFDPEKTKATNLSGDVNLPPGYEPSAEHELVFAAQGDRLGLWVDGKKEIDVKDGSLRAGELQLAIKGNSRIKKVEYGELPAVSVTDTTSAATKDAPFVNSLGMKFVPVPIAGGPSGGQRVLFSVWETRVQDYKIFSTETKREWKSPWFKQAQTHPAVNISWDDAQAFCAWLTEGERKAGRIGASERYRLPTDHEWSCAVGIGDREDPAMTPGEKDQKIVDLYPWGTAWPPPVNAGNYAGKEAEDPASPGKRILTEYRDDFVQTALVGSFAANRFGLFDLGGNASEWCEDRAGPGAVVGVSRGDAFTGKAREQLLSSHRRIKDSIGEEFIGFRVVLAPVP